MSSSHWSQQEVEAIVKDYFSMLASQLAGTPYNKTAHRKSLLPKLNDRSPQSIEFKHANISAVLRDVGFPYITGYKPRSNYQKLLEDFVVEQVRRDPKLLDLAAADVDRPIVMPEVDDILSRHVKRSRTEERTRAKRVKEPAVHRGPRLPTNYLEREALNRSLGLAGEEFILQFERERLIRAKKESLAAKIEHTSKVRGDHEGYDILSFETNGAERLIEVKTTKYGESIPFFVTRNELNVSKVMASQYYVYRLFTFRDNPRFFTLLGAIDLTCSLAEATYLARPK